MTSTVDLETSDGWDANKQDQIARTAAATPVQRLRWLEEAIAFAFRVGALPPQTTGNSTSTGSSPVS